MPLPPPNPQSPGELGAKNAEKQFSYCLGGGIFCFPQYARHQHHSTALKQIRMEVQKASFYSVLKLKL